MVEVNGGWRGKDGGGDNANIAHNGVGSKENTKKRERREGECVTLERRMRMKAEEQRPRDEG